MNRLLALALAPLLIVAGCATPPAPSSSAGASSDPAVASRPRVASAVPGPSTSGPTGAATPVLPIATATIGGQPVQALAAPKDLWERIRRGFAMPDLQGELVRDRVAWYVSRPDYIIRMTERSSKYLFHIVEELELRGMPTELALLPFVESAFNPQAVSSAKAAGMWQFMPATGKDFSLKQSVFRDDRRDVLASTRAALDYLQKLHRMFGDWHLALAAYNWGEGSVSRAIAKNQRAGLPTGYQDLTMPNETRYYVPKLQAIKNIVMDSARYQGALPDIPNHPYFDSIPIQRDIDVAVAARLAEVSAADFRSLNPSAHRPVILAEGTPQILLPWDNAVLFQRNLQSYNGKLASWTAWVAPATMRVSDAAQRNGMSESEFRSVNHIPPGMLVKAGSSLLVPRGESESAQQTNVASHVADNGQVSLAPEVVYKSVHVKARKRDTPASVAARYKLSAANVARWNGVGVGHRFKPGQGVTVMLPFSNLPGAQRPLVTVAHEPDETGNPKAGKSAKAPAKKGAKASATRGKPTPARAAAKTAPRKRK